MVAEAYQDDMAFQMYDATRGGQTIRVVEQLTVRDGRIASSVFVTDMAALAAFAGREAGMNRNPEVDRWFDQAGRPLDAAMGRARDIILGGRQPGHRVDRLARTMRFSDLDQLEAGRADLEAVIGAWCDWKAGSPAPG
jgi:hypothetical protein